MSDSPDEITESPIEDANADTQSAGDVTEPDAQGEPQGTHVFGRLSPSEAASLRWERVRARQADTTEQAAHDAETSGQAVIVRTTVQVGEIVKALAKDAKKGNTQAARELRAYLTEFPIETDTDVSALDKRTRQHVLAMLLDERLMRAIEDGRLPDVLRALDSDPPTPASDGTPTL